MELVKAEMDNTQLAKLVRARGIDFEPTDDYVQALRKAGAQDVLIAALHTAKPQPLTRDQVLHLVAGGVPSERAAVLVKQRGIDFLADEQYLEMLRLAGANDTLIAAVREASAAATAQLVVETSPNAEVYLDSELQGHADAQGELTMKAKLGTHALKVSLAGKKEFEQNLTLAVVQATRIEARLVDAPGSIRLRTLAGASISLDGASRGSADASGELVLANVPPGPHELRISASGKAEYRQNITVPTGKEARVEARLKDGGTLRVNPKDGLKYVWIPPGNAEEYDNVVQSVGPAIVNVSGEQWSLGNQVVKKGCSGVILSPDGYIVTSSHAIERAIAIGVTLYDGRMFRAKIVGVDPPTDVAVLKVDSTNIPTAPFGNSTVVKVGDSLFSLWSSTPGGLTVSRRAVIWIAPPGLGIAGLLQTDHNPEDESAGGALVDATGRVVGINATGLAGGTTDLRSDRGETGLAIPSNLLKHVLEDLIKTGRVTR